MPHLWAPNSPPEDLESRICSPFRGLSGSAPRVWGDMNGVNALRRLVVPNPEKGVSLWKSWPSGKRWVESDGISGKATN